MPAVASAVVTSAIMPETVVEQVTTKYCERFTVDFKYKES